MKRAFKMFKNKSKFSSAKISMGESSDTEFTISEINQITEPKCHFGFYGCFLFSIFILLENINYRGKN